MIVKDTGSQSKIGKSANGGGLGSAHGVHHITTCSETRKSPRAPSNLSRVSVSDLEDASLDKDDPADVHTSRGGYYRGEEGPDEGQDTPRPSSPFVLLDYEKGGNQLSCVGTADPVILNLEAEKRAITTEIQNLRAAETRRRDLLFAELLKEQQQRKQPPPSNSSSLSKIPCSLKALSSQATSVGMEIPTAPTAPDEEYLDSYKDDTELDDDRDQEELIGMISSKRPGTPSNGKKKVKNVENVVLLASSQHSSNYVDTDLDDSECEDDKDECKSDDETRPQVGKRQRNKSSRHHKYMASSNGSERAASSHATSEDRVACLADDSDTDSANMVSELQCLERVSRGTNLPVAERFSTTANTQVGNNNEYSKGTEVSKTCSSRGCAMNSSSPCTVDPSIAGGYVTRIAVGSSSIFEFVFNPEDAELCEAFHKAECDLLHREHAIIAQIEEYRRSRLARGAFFWQSDESASICAQCAKTFSLTVRKHHCRRCGQLLCNDCCSQVGRDMYAPQPRHCTEMEVDIAAAAAAEAAAAAAEGEAEAGRADLGRLRPEAFPPEGAEWMYDTYDLTEGPYGSSHKGGGSGVPPSTATVEVTTDFGGGSRASRWNGDRPREGAAAAATCVGNGRGQLQVRSAPWCRICNRCYLVCRRARNKHSYSRLLEDGLRCFHVLTEEEQSVMNFGTTWEMRCAQMDVLKHVVMERSINTANEQLRYLRGVLFSSFTEWGCAALRSLRLYGNSKE